MVTCDKCKTPKKPAARVCIRFDADPKHFHYTSATDVKLDLCQDCLETEKARLREFGATVEPRAPIPT